MLLSPRISLVSLLETLSGVGHGEELLAGAIVHGLDHLVVVVGVEFLV